MCGQVYSKSREPASTEFARSLSDQSVPPLSLARSLHLHASARFKINKVGNDVAGCGRNQPSVNTGVNHSGDFLGGKSSTGERIKDLLFPIQPVPDLPVNHRVRILDGTSMSREKDPVSGSLRHTSQRLHEFLHVAMRRRHHCRCPPHDVVTGKDDARLTPGETEMVSEVTGRMQGFQHPIAA